VALDKVAERAPSVILLDLMMPVMDEFEFVLEMRKRDASGAVPIVVVTAMDITPEDRQRLNGDVVGLIQRGGLDRDSLVVQLREQVAAKGRRAPSGPDWLEATMLDAGGRDGEQRCRKCFSHVSLVQEGPIMRIGEFMFCADFQVDSGVIERRAPRGGNVDDER
jgi:CheY-like chemotaxis protein